MILQRTILYFLTASALFGQAVITTVAGSGVDAFGGDGGPATAALMTRPLGVAVDAAGNIYIADTGNYRIRKVSSAGIITTVAGNGTPGIFLSGDGGPATAAPISLSLNFPGMAVDSKGNLYFSDSAVHRVRKVDTAGIITTFAGNGGVLFSGDGGPATDAALFLPLGLAVDRDDNLYIAETLNRRIRKVSPAGIITTVAGNGGFGPSGDGGPATSASFNGPATLAIDGSGNLYIGDGTNLHVRKVDRAGIITTVAGSGRTPGFAGDGGPATAALFRSVQGIAADSAGAIYIADRGNNRIRKVDASGTITTIAGTGDPGFSGDGGPATAAEIGLPHAVAVNTAGDVFLTDTLHHRIRKISAPPPARPAISANGVVNGASFRPGIVPNSWGTILGSNLASTTATWEGAIINGNLPATLAGVTVTVGVSPAYLYYVSPSQINFLAPDVPPGALQLTVTNASAASEAFTVAASTFGPAFFQWPRSQAVATRQDFSFAAQSGTFAGAETVPARPGDVIILWGTGFGPTNPAPPPGAQVPADKPYPTASLPIVTINDVPATVYGAALAPGFAGLYQVAIQAPVSMADGDWPVLATIGGAVSPAGVLLSVRR